MLNRGYWVTTILSVVALAFVTNVMMQTGRRERRRQRHPAWIWFFLRRRGRPGHQRRLRLHHAVLHGRLVPPGAGDRRGVQDRPGHQHHHRHGRRLRDDRRDRHHASASRCSLSHWLGQQARPGDADGNNVGGIFGTAVATMGMLMTTAYILAMDTFGPITDNAGGIAEFSQRRGGRARDHRPPRRRGQHHQGPDQGLCHRVRVAGRVPALHRLHRQGQPDPGSPDRRRRRDAHLLTSVNLRRRASVFVAALIGAMLVYFFSSLAIRAVGTTAPVDHRRGAPPVPRDARHHGLHPAPRLRPRRRHHHPRRPARDGRCPASWRWRRPIVVGVLLGYRGRGRPADGRHHRRRAAGDRPQQRRRRLGQRQEVHRGRPPARCRRQRPRQGHEAHAAAVVGDTVGDPFKDTAGPSLHVLVKLLATITLVLAPLFIR